MKTVASWLALTVAIVGLCTTVRAAPGDVDYAFATAGRLYHTGTVLALHDGRVATFDTAGGLPELKMYRADGTTDITYGDGGTARYAAIASAGFTAHVGAAHVDHSILLLGNRAALLKLNPAGTIATEFGGAGTGLSVIDASAGSAALAIDAQGRALVVITPSCPDPTCSGPLRLVRLRADGRVDASFGTAGQTVLSGIEGASLQPALLAARRGGGAVVVDFYGRAFAVNAAGQPDPAFGTAGVLRPGTGFPAYVARANLLPDDRLLLAGPVAPNEPTRPRLTMLTAAGERDSAFAGDGTLDLAELDVASIADAAPGQPFELIDVAPAADGGSVYLLVGFGLRDTAPFTCVGILALTTTGAVRADFARNGFSCISKDFPYYASLIGQPTGALLFTRVDTGTDENLVDRISTGVAGGRGLAGFRLRRSTVDESAGRAEIAVSRLAGRDRSATLTYQIWGQSASDGTDFVAETGTLTWPAGDSSDRSITVRLIDDNLQEQSESVGIRLLQGDIPVTGGDFLLTISDSDTAASPNPTPAPAPTPNPPGSPSSGGGGRIDAALLAVLLASLFARAAAAQSSRKTSHSKMEWRARRDSNS